MAEVVVKGLQPGQKYYVQIRGRNNDGVVSAWSSVYSFSTPSDMIVTQNKVIQTFLYSSAGIYAASNMFMNSDGIFAYTPGQALSPSTRTIAIEASTGNAYFSGTVVAGAGMIGGWEISSDALTKGNVGFYAPAGTPSSSEIAIFSGSSKNNRATAPFRVDYAGNLVATNANISGSISATSGSIGGFTIGATALTANNIVLSSTNGFALGSASQFRVDLSGNASVAGKITAQSGSITGDLSISSAGRLIAGDLATNVVIVSGAGITGAQGGIPTFTLPSDGTPPTIGGFQVVQTGLVGYGQTTIYPVSGTASNTLTMAASAASTLWIGMSASGPNTPSTTLITQINTTTGVVTLSANNTASFANGSVTFTPNANLVVGTSASNNIVIRGQNAPGLPPAIFTRINNVATTDSSGTGFYVDQNGKVNIGNKLKWDGSLLTVEGSGSFTGNITASAGYIGGANGWIIGSASLTGGTSGSTVGLIVPDANGGVTIFAGNSTPSSAPFRVTNTGSLTATNAVITGNITATSGSVGGFLIESNTIRNSASGTNSFSAYDPSFETGAFLNLWNASVTITNQNTPGAVYVQQSFSGENTIDSGLHSMSMFYDWDVDDVVTASSISAYTDLIPISSLGIVATSASNLLPNPSFETNTTGWNSNNSSISRTSASSYSGDASLQIVTSAAAGAGTFSNLIPVTANQNYSFSVYANTASTASVAAQINWLNSSSTAISQSLGSVTTLTIGSWTRVFVSATAPATAAFARAVLYTNGAGNPNPLTFYLDAALLEQSNNPSEYKIYSWSAWLQSASLSRSMSMQALLYNSSSTLLYSNSCVKSTSATGASYASVFEVPYSSSYVRFAIIDNTSSGTASAIAMSNKELFYIDTIQLNSGSSVFAYSKNDGIVVTGTSSVNSGKMISAGPLDIDGNIVNDASIDSDGTMSAQSIHSPLISMTGNSTEIDFYTSGNQTQDAQIYVSGGTTTPNDGVLRIYSRNLTVNEKSLTGDAVEWQLKNGISTASWIIPTTTNTSSWSTYCHYLRQGNWVRAKYRARLSTTGTLSTAGTLYVRLPIYAADPNDFGSSSVVWEATSPIGTGLYQPATGLYVPVTPVFYNSTQFSVRVPSASTTVRLSTWTGALTPGGYTQDAGDQWYFDVTYRTA